MTPREKADAILWDLTRFRNSLRLLQEDVEAELARVREKYQPEISRLEAAVERRAKDLKTLAKQERSAIFDGKDQVTLKNGVLLYTRVMKVRIPRDALVRIKEQGWLDGIRVAESVNRPVVEKWPDEKLAVIGAERKQVESFSYELK